MNITTDYYYGYYLPIFSLIYPPILHSYWFHNIVAYVDHQSSGFPLSFWCVPRLVSLTHSGIMEIIMGLIAGFVTLKICRPSLLIHVLHLKRNWIFSELCINCLRFFSFFTSHEPRSQSVSRKPKSPCCSSRLDCLYTLFRISIDPALFLYIIHAWTSTAFEEHAKFSLYTCVIGICPRSTQGYLRNLIVLIR